MELCPAAKISSVNPPGAARHPPRPPPHATPSLLQHTFHPAQEDVSALLPLAELMKCSAATAGTSAECIAADQDLGPAAAFFSESGSEEQCAIM